MLLASFKHFFCHFVNQVLILLHKVFAIHKGIEVVEATCVAVQEAIQTYCPIPVIGLFFFFEAQQVDSKETKDASKSQCF